MVSCMFPLCTLKRDMYIFNHEIVYNVYYILYIVNVYRFYNFVVFTLIYMYNI